MRILLVAYWAVPAHEAQFLGCVWCDRHHGDNPENTDFFTVPPDLRRGRFLFQLLGAEDYDSNSIKGEHHAFS